MSKMRKRSDVSGFFIFGFRPQLYRTNIIRSIEDKGFCLCASLHPCLPSEPLCTPVYPCAPLRTEANPCVPLCTPVHPAYSHHPVITATANNGKASYFLAIVIG